MRTRQASKWLRPAQPFWSGPKFRAWDSSQYSSLIVVRGSYNTRFEVQDFCVDVISQLNKSKIPIVWVLKSMGQAKTSRLSTINVLKNLTSQVLRLNKSLHKERSLMMGYDQVRNAETEHEWCDLLALSMNGLSRLYVVLDIEALDPSLSYSNAGTFWPTAFLKIFEEMSKQGLKTVVKVIIGSYGSIIFRDMPQQDLRELVVAVNGLRTAPSSAKVRISSRNVNIANNGGSKIHRRLRVPPFRPQST